MSNVSSNDLKQHYINETYGDGRQDNAKYLTSYVTNKNESDSDTLYNDYSIFSAEIHEEFIRNIHKHTSVFAVFLSVWTFVINILIILACVGNREVRYYGYYNQIVNLSVSNLLISGFVIPLTVYHIQHAWDLGQALCKIYVIADVLLTFTSIIIILIINIDRIMSLVHPRLYSWIFQKSLKSVIICTPWFTAVVIVVPIWTSGTIPYENGPGECTVLISKESAILCPLMTFFMPLVALILLTLKLLLLKIQETASSAESIENARQSIKTYRDQQNEADRENNEFIMVTSSPSTSTAIIREKKGDIVGLCAVNVFYALMWFPFQCTSFLLAFCHSQSCIPSVDLNQVITWVAASSVGIVPIFWLIDFQLRRSLRKSCIQS